MMHFCEISRTSEAVQGTLVFQYGVPEPPIEISFEKGMK